jgi:hypothetical protein
MSSINTTHGVLDETTLTRTVGFEDRPSEFVVWVEWRKPACADDCAICRQPEMPPPVNGHVLMRRDAHCILKEPSVIADALAASIG